MSLLGVNDKLIILNDKMIFWEDIEILSVSNTTAYWDETFNLYVTVRKNTRKYYGYTFYPIISSVSDTGYTFTGSTYNIKECESHTWVFNGIFHTIGTKNINIKLYSDTINPNTKILEKNITIEVTASPAAPYIYQLIAPLNTYYNTDIVNMGSEVRVANSGGTNTSCWISSHIISVQYGILEYANTSFDLNAPVVYGHGFNLVNCVCSQNFKISSTTYEWVRLTVRIDLHEVGEGGIGPTNPVVGSTNTTVWARSDFR